MADKHDQEAINNSLPVDRKRRRILKGIGFIGAGVGAGALERLLLSDEQVLGAQTDLASHSETIHVAQATSNPGEIPRRKLGSTGVEVSAIGLGGSARSKSARHCPDRHEEL